MIPEETITADTFNTFPTQEFSLVQFIKLPKCGEGDPGDVRGEGVSNGSSAVGSCGEGTAWGGCERGRGVTAQTVTSGVSGWRAERGNGKGNTAEAHADVGRCGVQETAQN